MQKIHLPLRKKANLIPILEQLSDERKVQLWVDDSGTHYVKYLAYKMTPSELDAKLSILSGKPAFYGSGSGFSSIPLKE